MEKGEKLTASVESIGLSQREFLTLFLLHSLSKKRNYPRAIHGELKSSFTGKVHSYDYLCKIAKQLVGSGHLSLYTEKRRNYYQITDKGKELFAWYQNNFSARFTEVKLVIDRFVYDLTGSGPNPAVTHDLPEEYRSYISKIVSVKDLVRYVTLKTLFSKKPIYMGEIADLLKHKFGWIASNGYLYDLSHEMEEMGLLVGRWESEKRTKRYLRITDEGQYHYKQIADSAAHHVQEVQKYLASVLSFLEKE
ncbi:helix-turn-helix transcriptional regulator [Peribacillus asahii]|uniref:helix-turn-helix transcriptional regulator n=1 Tax=Peribacillus asahii TaxID=228899 RepID=UPI00207A945A|nr:helix-turn-helix transcriptional regulator [Peribacillus asahii]USK57957.1 helix-turn-helix transcriptional regulator [Peribacillus asahii]HWL25678.1 helix-turn-helix transcriptional regulator [Ureibacillus sp.]